MCPGFDSNASDSLDRSIVRVGGSMLAEIADVELKPTGKYGVHTIGSSDLSSSNAGLDAFGRLRVSSPETIFDAAFRWDKQPVTWAESTTLSATVTHDANKASVVLAVANILNSDATFQSRQYIHYHPGKSQLIMISGNFIDTAANVTKEIGFFDDDNGVFFRLTGSTLSIVRRTKTSGSVVDNAVAQSSWNIDKLDGTGSSGITLDVTKQQIFVIDFQWLGSGRVRYGFGLNGRIVYCHEDNNANSLTVPWSQTGDYPIRAKIHTNSLLSTSSMHITCAAVICENFWSPEGQLRSVSNGTTLRTVNTTLPIISLRKQSAFVNVPVELLEFDVFGSSADDFLVQIIYNGTLTNPNWTNVAGVCQQDVAATAITGGTLLNSFYVRAAAGAASSMKTDIFRDSVNAYLGRDVAGNSDIISIYIQSLTGSANLAGAINYKELL